jgi:hypothetical protein
MGSREEPGAGGSGKTDQPLPAGCLHLDTGCGLPMILIFLLVNLAVDRLHAVIDPGIEYR